MKIYKLILLFVLYFFLTSIPGFSFESLIGVRTGVTLPTFSSTDYENILADLECTKKFKPGFTGGFFYELILTDNFSVQPELLFTMAGTSYENTTYSQTININFIELPVLACFKEELKVGSIKFFGGLSGSLVLGPINLVSQPSGAVTDYSSSINFLAAGLIVGGSYSFPIPTGLIFIDTRYVINFSPLYRDFGANNTRQHYLSFSFGYAYRLQ